jgi:hypothetical protein
MWTLAPPLKLFSSTHLLTRRRLDLDVRYVPMSTTRNVPQSHRKSRRSGYFSTPPGYLATRTTVRPWTSPLTIFSSALGASSSGIS